MEKKTENGMKETKKNGKSNGETKPRAKKTYRPQPLDTSDVKVPEELMELAEEMAKNVHEVWAQSRIDQGWTWGERRDDSLKTHPDLIPYEELTEQEKDYDRNTSIETLKLILKLGFKITK